MHSPLELQQPAGHDVALHTHCPVVLQVNPVPQGSHVAPPVPQTLADWALKDSHWPAALQQPCGQLVALHGMPVASDGASTRASGTEVSGPGLLESRLVLSPLVTSPSVPVSIVPSLWTSPLASSEPGPPSVPGPEPKSPSKLVQPLSTQAASRTIQNTTKSRRERIPGLAEVTLTEGRCRGQREARLPSPPRPQPCPRSITANCPFE
jgi:hypothetical protein